MEEVKSDLSKERLIIFQKTAEEIKTKYKKAFLTKKLKSYLKIKLKMTTHFLVEMSIKIQ